MKASAIALGWTHYPHFAPMHRRALVRNEGGLCPGRVRKKKLRSSTAPLADPKKHDQLEP
eukprot:5163786-Pyramimonas_sp.AAC.1